jgi:long-subunit acyl-CoA synthetase (AMP-forming)
MVQILIGVGYAPESARQWTNIMEGIRPHLQPTLDWMEVHRQKVMAKMDENLEYATYDELRKSLEALTNGVQLLGGKPTQNIAISAEVRHKIDTLIED